MSFFQRTSQQLSWVPFVIFSFLSVLWLTWQLLSMVNFSYPFWYQALSIDAHIEKYAPVNRHKENFQLTTEQERFDLFSQVVDSINAGGEGLSEIQYHDASGAVIDTLYWRDELTHLQDVSNLITLLDYAAYFSLFIVAIYLLRIFAIFGRQPLLPQWRAAHIATGGLLLLIAVLIFIVGPKAVFYWLHDLVFPPGNPWFFYYQDSLMSTAMKAPDLFGGIAAQWVLLTLLMYILWVYILGYAVEQTIKLSGKSIHR